MPNSETPSLIRCRNCGAPMDVPPSHRVDGLESIEGRTAKCPRCGYVNAADSPSAESAVSVKTQQMVRRV